MTLLTIVMAIAAPMLSHSLRGRHLKEEATRFLALTEYGRDEAISQGVPMIVWADPTAGQFGVQPKPGFVGVDGRAREHTLNSDVHFDTADGTLVQKAANLIEFAPDGAPEAVNIENVKLADRYGATTVIVKSADGWGYEIAPVVQQ
ncbi:MAG: hypothetical protein QOD99_2524 [Chthoniobacter sp.]|nr:hypothetical protein [Chthoniobacter sp.]